MTLRQGVTVTTSDGAYSRAINLFEGGGGKASAIGNAYAQRDDYARDGRLHREHGRFHRIRLSARHLGREEAMNKKPGKRIAAAFSCKRRAAELRRAGGR